MQTYVFRKQIWEWDDGLRSLVEASKGDKVSVEIHAQVNSIMIGMLVSACVQGKESGTDLEVVIFEKNTEKSLSIPGIQKIIKCRLATDEERRDKCENLCRNKCH